MKYGLLTITMMLMACSPFNDAAKYTRVRDENGYRTIVNAQAGITVRTFYDFKFATDRSGLKRLNKRSADFNNIIVYGQTTADPYDYYLLAGPKIKNVNGFILKDTVIGQKRFAIAVSERTPEADRRFLFAQLFSFQPE